MAKKQDTQFKKSASKAILVIPSGILGILAIAYAMFFLEIEEDIKIWVYLVGGACILILIGLIYCAYCAMIKKKQLDNPNSLDAEYERMKFENKNVERKKITSDELLQRFQEGKTKK